MDKVLIVFLVSCLTVFKAYGKTDYDRIEIKGYLHYAKVDEWSKNIVDESFSIWNAVIGEGSLKHPAGDTLFVVKAKHANSKSKMTVLVTKKTDQKKQVLKNTWCSPVFSKSSKTLVCSFMVPDFHYGDLEVQVKYRPKGSRGEVLVKTAEINYGGCAK